LQGIIKDLGGLSMIIMVISKEWQLQEETLPPVASQPRRLPAAFKLCCRSLSPIFVAVAEQKGSRKIGFFNVKM
jgi:hypothetical protein